MLTTHELAEYCDRRQLTHQARRIIDQVRNSPPSRRVKSGARNVACRFATRKMGCVIQAESHTNELPAVVGWEYDKTTFEFYDQPPKIKVSYLGLTNRRHAHLVTPDFFLLQEGFAGWVECKTEDWLRARAKEGSNFYVPDEVCGWRCPPGEEYAASVGLGFRVWSSAQANWVAVRNAQFLADYLDERAIEPTEADFAEVMNFFNGQGAIVLKELLDAGVVSADLIFRMIARRMLHVALDRDLLAEPERTHLFRDEMAVQAYFIHHDDRQPLAIPNFQAIRVAVGQSLVWDGRTFRVANVGIEDVYLEDQEGAFTHLSKTAIEHLVREGKISSVPELATANSDQAAKAIRSASPADVAHAMERYKALFPEKLGASKAKFSDRALRKWRALYRKAEATQGSGFLGLFPKFHQRGSRERKLDARVVEIMNEVIDELYATAGEKTLVSCWGEVIARCGKDYPAPSEETFRKEVRRRRPHDLRVAREGEKAAYDEEEFFWWL